MVNRILNLLKEKNISCHKAEQDLGFGNGAIKRFETSAPSINKISAIASYLNVSIDYLLGRTNNPKEKKPTDESVSFEKFTEILHEKGLTEKDIEQLSKEKLIAVVEVIKNFKQ